MHPRDHHCHKKIISKQKWKIVEDKLQYNGTNHPSRPNLGGVEILTATFCQEHGAEHLDIRPNDANAALIVDTFKYTPEFAALAQESGSDPGSDSDLFKWKGRRPIVDVCCPSGSQSTNLL